MVFTNILYLSGGPGQIVGVKQVDVIPGSQQKTTSLLVQQQRVGVEAIGGAQEQRHTAGLQQFWPAERETDKIRRQTKRLMNPGICFITHHLALDYSTLGKRKKNISAGLRCQDEFILFNSLMPKSPKQALGFLSKRKNVSWLDLKLPNPLWFNTLATHADREEIQ